MRILIVPLNWGLGHATRCIPLIRQYLNEGADVVLGGTGESLVLLRRTFPQLKSVELASLRLRYSQGKSQVSAFLRAIPQGIRFVIQNRKMTDEVVRIMGIDRVISDNCFGVHSPRCENIYITHQLHICLPEGWKRLEPLASQIHARMYKDYQQIWVPDNAERDVLSGVLGHPEKIDERVRYIGPLSRFGKADCPESKVESQKQISEIEQGKYDVVAVLSGLEPQRSIFEKELVSRYSGSNKQVLIVRGKISGPRVRSSYKNITLVPYLDDAELQKVLYGAERIIARSGYSTIMDLWALGLLHKAELHPTPGQSEQEYLARFHKQVRTLL